MMLAPRLPKASIQPSFSTVVPRLQKQQGQDGDLGFTSSSSVLSYPRLAVILPEALAIITNSI
jgi:hypothetical protein